MTRAAIICVDDDFVILNSLGEQLKRNFGRDYDIELVNSGTEAIALCAELVSEAIDIPVIISDQNMSEMMGDRLLIELHALYPNTLKILLTGQVDAEAIGNLVNADALYRYFTKPWSETDLILTVKEALKLYRQERRLAAQNKTLLEVNQQLESSNALLRATLEATADGIIVFDRHGKVVDFNQKFIDIWGLPATVGSDRQRVLKLVRDELTEPYRSSLKGVNSFSHGKYSCLELKNGKILECYNQTRQIQTRTVGHVWSFRDITEQKKAQALIQHQAYYDSLTNLPNRAFFNLQLTKAIERAGKGKMLAVLFLDLDRFKIINDTLGHTIGDLLLNKVVERLKKSLREQDLISRWGGDEFTVLLPEITCREDADAIANRILEALKPSFDIEDLFLHVTCSIGIAVFPDDGDNANTLLKNADAALHRVKEQGRNNYQHYITTNSQAYRLFSIENDLHSALRKQEFALYYQPIIQVATGKIVKMEVLLRWQHPKFGLVPPNLFIPIAEENGLIVEIGTWVLQTACAQAKSWQEMDLSPVAVAVNLSARQFRSRNLVATIDRILAETNLESCWLELEITETATFQNLATARKVLLDLSRRGISLAMDDFGTGYSSLSYLKEFPFNTIKIDRSFIKDLSVDTKNLAIIEAIIALGKGLELQIVAEGVESPQLKTLLEDLQCDYMQGYLINPPTNVIEATALVRQGQILGDRRQQQV